MQCHLRNIYVFIYTQVLVIHLEVFATISVLDKGLEPLEKDSVGLQLYIDLENKDSLHACKISTSIKDCCLTDGEETDCIPMYVYGASYIIKSNERNVLVLVYPSLHQYDLIGYCHIGLNYQCGRKRRSRKYVNISFNTRLNSKNKIITHLRDKKQMSCESIDRDPLNNCEAVNCDHKYCGARPIFDGDTEKCVTASMCLSDPGKLLPDIVYVPNANICRDLEHPITVADIYEITTGVGVVTDAPNQYKAKVEIHSNCTTISQNLKLLRDLMSCRLYPVEETDTSGYAQCCLRALKSIFCVVIGICALLIGLVICLRVLSWGFKLVEERNIDCWSDLKSKIRRCRSDGTKVNREVRNKLLREVIARDIPIELRDSMVDVCAQMSRKMRKKKRYRRSDLGSQMSLNKQVYCVRGADTSSTCSLVQE